jgi:hypothetical protein
MAGSLPSINVSAGFSNFGRRNTNLPWQSPALQGAKSPPSASSPLPYTEGEFRALVGRSQQITGGKAH